MIKLQAPGLDITFHLQLLDGTKCDVTFHDISRVEANEKIYKLQEMTVGTKIDYVSMKQNEVKTDNKVFKNCKYTQRGFAMKEFKDRYGAKCSLQESSLVDPSIWLGVDEKQDEEFLEQFKASGPYTRMHLSYNQVEKLVADLQNWLEKYK